MSRISDALVALAETMSGQSNLTAEDIVTAIELIAENFVPSTQVAGADQIGGIKAAAKDAGDTVECKIDADSKKLYTAPYALPAAAADALGGVMLAENQADCTAATVAATVADLNALLAKLKAAGIMAADAEPGG